MGGLQMAQVPVTMRVWVLCQGLSSKSMKVAEGSNSNNREAWRPLVEAVP